MVSDPLKNVDPWEHVQRRREYIEQAQLEVYKVFGDAFAGVVVENNSEYMLESGQVLTNVHSKDRCGDKPCPLHGPSDHPLNKAPRSWQMGIIFRHCEHGVDHPDYDSIAYLLDRDGAVCVTHGCCGSQCCGIPTWVEIGEIDG